MSNETAELPPPNLYAIDQAMASLQESSQTVLSRSSGPAVDEEALNVRTPHPVDADHIPDDHNPGQVGD